MGRCLLLSMVLCCSGVFCEIATCIHAQVPSPETLSRSGQGESACHRFIEADSWASLQSLALETSGNESYGIVDETPCPESHTTGALHEPVLVGDFPHSILIPGTKTSFKIGGYAKADFIYDFNSIGNRDEFDTSTIPTSGPQIRNTNLQAQQTRLNLDVRHLTELGDVQIFIEGDFYGSGNTLRLRHAYGKLGPVLVGQTWSTFMDELIIPDLVDFESPTGVLLTRRAQMRWTQSITVVEGLEYSLAVEDPIPTFSSTTGTLEGGLPDFISRLRYQNEWAHLQLAGFVNKASFIPTVGTKSNATAWGTSLSGSLKVTTSDRLMAQVAHGDGLQRFRGDQSYTLDAGGGLIAVPALGCYVGYEHQWTPHLKSVLAFSRANTDQPSGAPTALKSTDYLAANILWTPVERIRLGGEYLRGDRIDQNSSRGTAHRLQLAVWYYLP